MTVHEAPMDHQPQRGDIIEHWLRIERDKHEQKDDQDVWAYQAIDGLLEDYIIMADTGNTMEQQMRAQAQAAENETRSVSKASVVEFLAANPGLTAEELIAQAQAEL